MLLFFKNLLFTVLVPGTVAFYLPWRIAAGWGEARLPPWGLVQVLALPVLGLGAAVYFRCLWDFATAGRGTPAPIDAPRRLVVRGLYRFTRNPMYVGVLLVLAGWALFFRSGAVLAYGAVVAVVFHLFIVLLEEPVLARKFGADYEAYRRRVGRWLPRRAKGV